MDFNTCWLLLLLANFALIESDVASEQISELSGGSANKSELGRGKNLLTAMCYEYLMTEPDISEAALTALKLAKDEFKSKLQLSDDVISGLKSTVDGLKKTEEANNRTIQEQREKQKQLQATIDDLTKTVESLNQTTQLLCGKPNDACRYLLEAAQSGDVNTVKILFKCTKHNCTTDNSYRSAPLLLAAGYGRLEVVRVLLEGGDNMERRNAYQWTALQGAAWGGHLDVCSLLLDWGAKVDHQDKWKNTPLHEAAWNGYLSIVKLLVERGADVRLKGNDGKTASDQARDRGHNDVAEWLDSVSRV